MTTFENNTNCQGTSVQWNTLVGDEIVISGISGRFPESDNMAELRDNLYSKRDMVIADAHHYDLSHPEIPPQGGKVKDITKLDAGYFGLSYREANLLSPMVRLTLESVSECLIDAGYAPGELEGTKTGVFLTQIWDDQSSANTRGFNFLYPNHISKKLKLKGPSYCVNSACSSSMTAFEQGYKAILNGECDYAIVGGAQLFLHPMLALQFFRLGVLSPTGSCQVFNQDADGYARSEAAATVFLQRSSNARRIYAIIADVKVNSDGYKAEGVSFPSTQLQATLLKDVYNDQGLDPSDLGYFEAHATATKVGDIQEINAIDEVVAKHSKDPIWVGGVKSNLGHAESISGMCSIAKAVLILESGLIPPNLHFRQTKKGLDGIESGRLKVVTDVVPFDNNKTLLGINNLGIGGSNCHLTLRRWSKVKANNGFPLDNSPRLVCVSGRNREAITTILDDVNKRPLDVEYVGLLQKLFSKDIKGHNYRGFTIVSKKNVLSTLMGLNPIKPRDLVIKFNDMEDCWKTLQKVLIELPTFKNSLLRTKKILSMKNKNLISSFTSTISNEPLTNAMGALAVKVGIVDVLKTIQVKPNNLIGEKLDRLVCAYFEDIITQEEVILMGLELSENSKKMVFEKDFEEMLYVLRQNHSEHSNGYAHNSGIIPQYNSGIPKKSIVLNIANQRNNGINIYNAQNNEVTFLEAIGRLYLEGYEPQIAKLYPEVQFPVSRNTPMIGALIKWNHDKEWDTQIFGKEKNLRIYQVDHKFSIRNSQTKYIIGHVINGRNLFPATGYLQLVWETLALALASLQSSISVIFKNCKFLKAVNVPPTGSIILTVSIQRGTGNFEITENGNAVVTGRILLLNNDERYQTQLAPAKLNENPAEILEMDEIYRELNLRGYQYSGLFKGLTKCNSDGSYGLIRWEGNWVSFMDKMLQMKILQLDSRLLYVPVEIEKIIINTKQHPSIIINKNSEDNFIPVQLCATTGIIKAGGIEIHGLKASAIAKRKLTAEPVIEKYQFVPNIGTLTTEDSIRVQMQIILENTLETMVKVVEIIDESTLVDSQPLLPIVNDVLADEPLIRTDLTISSASPIEDIAINVTQVNLNKDSNYLLIVASNILQRPKLLQDGLKALKSGGFMLSRENRDYLVEEIDGVDIIINHLVDNERLVLFRKHHPTPNAVLVQVTNDDLNWLPELQSAMKNNQHVIIYSRNQPTAGILGLINCIKREPGGRNVSCFFIVDGPKFESTEILYKKQIQINLVTNVYKDSKWGTYRHLALEKPQEVESEHSYVNVLSRDLSSLRWFEGPLTMKEEIPKNKILIHNYYVALNFKDIMIASGRLSLDIVTKTRMDQECAIGFEFSGREKCGRRLMGMTTNGALSTLVLADPCLLWTIPNSWSLEDAATIPAVYATVLYAFFIRGNLKRDSSILIHSGTGGIGIAAINTALHYRCNIFVTVGTQEKKEFLRNHFPQIPESHIGNSRDTTFETMVKKETHGRGVDFVLNSLAEEKLLASVRCLAPGGVFLEIGKFDMAKNHSLQLLLFDKNASYHGIMLDEIFSSQDPNIKKTLKDIVDEGIKEGYVKPLPKTIFEKNDVESAFRFMATGKHMGKVLVKVQDEEKEKTTKPKQQLFKSLPRFTCDTSKSYIIIGGLGGFGLELADWLVLRGAKYLIITSRIGIQNGYQSQRIRLWKSYGVSVIISTADVTQKTGCKELIQDAIKLAPVDGIFNLAVILKDAVLENQAITNYEQVLGPKAYAAQFLDELSRQLCPTLRYFVVFSSVSCGRGNPGQTNYGMANSIMERICEERHKQGLPAVAIEWGAVGDVGLVAKMQKDHRELEIGGTLQQKIASCLELMDRFLRQKHPVVASMVVAEKRSKTQGCSSAVEAVASILGIKDVKTVSLHASLAELGMDSITGTEVGQVLANEFDMNLTAKEIRSMTFTQLIELEDDSKLEESVEKAENSENKTLEDITSILRYIPGNSILPEPVISMPTATTNDRKRDPVVFIFSGVESVLRTLEPLTKKLQANVLGLQYNYRNPEDSIPEMAKAFIPNILQNLPQGKSFNIIGHSYGVVVALEIAHLLEKQGYIGNIVAIDGSPALVHSSMTQLIPSQDEEEFQISLLCGLMSLFLSFEIVAESREKLLRCENFDSRIKVAMETIPTEMANAEKIEKQTVITTYKRFKAGINYKYLHEKLQSNVTLFKASKPIVKGLEDDYSLSQYCHNPIKVTEIDGDHETILNNEILADTINSLLKN